MKKYKIRNEWIDKLDDQEIRRLLKMDLYFQPLEWTENKILNSIKSENDIIEEKKYSFRNGLKFALSFTVIIALVSSIFIWINIFNKKQINATSSLNNCIVKYVNGTAYSLNESTGNRKALKAGDKLDEKAVVVTEADANVEIEIDDSSVILIKEKSKLKTIKLFKDTGIKITLLELVKGEIFNDLQKLKKGSSFEVLTKSVTAGVRGTKFLVKVLDNNDVAMKVDEGTVYVRLNKDQRIVDIIKKFSSLNYEKIKIAYETEKSINAGEMLWVKEKDFREANDKNFKTFQFLNELLEKESNYQIDEKILMQVKNLNEAVLGISKQNESEKEELKKESKIISDISKENSKKENENKDTVKKQIPPYEVIKSTVLKSDTETDTYKLITDSFGKNSFHSPDYEGYHKGVRHIIQGLDNEVGNYFKFLIHRDIDKYSYGNSIQNKVSIFLNRSAPYGALAYKGDAFRYYFKMKVDNSLILSDKSTRFFSVSPYMGNNQVSYNIIALDAVKKSRDILRITNSLEDKTNILAETNFISLKEKWIQAEFIIKYADIGYLKVTIKDLSGNNLLSYENDNILIWRDNAEFVIPNWMFIRNIDEYGISSAAAESVSFADLTIQKIKLNR